MRNITKLTKNQTVEIHKMNKDLVTKCTHTVKH